MASELWNLTTATIKDCVREKAPSRTQSSLFVDYFTVAFSYAVDGGRYGGKFYSSHEWEKEAEVSLLYNPQNPLETFVCDEDGSQIAPVLSCALELLGGILSCSP